MPATLLRDCLRSLGSPVTQPISYISIDYGYTDNLDKLCNAISPGMTFDQSRTTSLPDAGGSNAYFYPDHCGGRGWLGVDCWNGYPCPNWEGFYCKT